MANHNVANIDMNNDANHDVPFMMRGICKSYSQGGKRLDILKDVDFSIKKGEMVALLGPSGSGKSTFLHIAGLLDQCDAGEVILNGKNIAQQNDRQRTLTRRAHIGFVYQFHHLLPEFTAAENLVIAQMIDKKPYKAAMDKATSLLDQLGLAERVHHRPAQLSGGEQQRVAIARALMNDPDLLLADEPTGNLDPHTSQAVFDILTNLVEKRQVSALIATHNIDLAKKMDRIVMMSSGQLKTISHHDLHQGSDVFGA